MIFLADTRGEIADYVLAVALVYTILIFAQIVIQMAFNFGARIPYYRWTDAVFDFLVATTMVRALTQGLADHERFCDETADALAALAHSTWHPRRRAKTREIPRRH